MSVLERFIRIFAPHSCIGCDSEEDQLLCADCVATLPRYLSCCYRCGTATAEYAVCDDCASGSPLSAAVAATPYEGLARGLVHRLKFERAQAAAAEMAAMLAAVQSWPDDAVLVHAPTAPQRVRMRGYDQAALLARELSCRTGLRCSTWLVRAGNTRQVGMSRADRFKQLAAAFRLAHGANVQGRHIILVDDVLTSGATLESAAHLLRAAGARRVDAVVFARKV